MGDDALRFWERGLRFAFWTFLLIKGFRVFDRQSFSGHGVLYRVRDCELRVMCVS